jgi:hypothetical protein
MRGSMRHEQYPGAAIVERFPSSYTHCSFHVGDYIVEFLPIEYSSYLMGREFIPLRAVTSDENSELAL